MEQSKKIKNKVLVFVYGSLKKGFHNHGFIKDAEYISDAKLNGFKMVSLGSYPAIYQTGNDCDSVKGEVYLIDGFDLERIHYMELSAGYNFNEYILEAGKRDYEAIVYYMDEKKCLSRKVVESGEWIIEEVETWQEK